MKTNVKLPTQPQWLISGHLIRPIKNHPLPPAPRSGMTTIFTIFSFYHGDIGNKEY